VTLLGDSAGGGFQYKVRFQNASQLVKGNLVQVSGRKIGLVEDLDLTRNGQAEVTISVNEEFAPLRRGTQVTVRQASLSGVANRYLDLRLPPEDAQEIDDGGTIEQTDTTTAVDLDQLFNTVDEETKTALQGLIQGSAAQFKGKGEQMNAGLAYLNPSLSASSRLFRELNRDSDLLERFIVSSSQLVTDVADRRDDLAGLVDNLATTTTSIGNEQAALAESIDRLPDFMRRANTTFLNLRGALDDLDPLVEDSKPVAKELRPLLAELRPLARDARPTLRDLSKLIKSTGAGNDLIDLFNAQPATRDAVLKTTNVNGKEREGAFPAAAKAFKGGTPIFNFFRPYTPDLLGWFDDFSHTGVYDALGGVSRVGTHANPFLLTEGVLSPIPPELRDEFFNQTASRGQNNRCPGSAEHPQDDKSNPWKPTADFPCDPTQLLPGE